MALTYTRANGEPGALCVGSTHYDILVGAYSLEALNLTISWNRYWSKAEK